MRYQTMTQSKSIPTGTKPCPFCGSKKQYIRIYSMPSTGDTKANIQCSCGVLMRLDDEELESVISEMLIDKWNTRTEDK